MRWRCRFVYSQTDRKWNDRAIRRGGDPSYGRMKSWVIAGCCLVWRWQSRRTCALMDTQSFSLQFFHLICLLSRLQQHQQHNLSTNVPATNSRPSTLLLTTTSSLSPMTNSQSFTSLCHHSSTAYPMWFQSQIPHHFDIIANTLPISEPLFSIFLFLRVCVCLCVYTSIDILSSFLYITQSFIYIYIQTNI